MLNINITTFLIFLLCWVKHIRPVSNIVLPEEVSKVVHQSYFDQIGY